MLAELRLQLSEVGADAERPAVLTGYLQEEFVQLDADDVTVPQASEAAPDVRVVAVAAVGAPLAALGQPAKGRGRCSLHSGMSCGATWEPTVGCGWNATTRPWNFHRRVRPITNG